MLVSGNGGQSRTVVKTVTVARELPPPMPLTAAFSVSPTNPRMGVRVAFAATASGDTPPYAFAWDFGNGGSASGTYHQVNTALVLGFAYSWPGIGAYLVASLWALVNSLRAERKRPGA